MLCLWKKIRCHAFCLSQDIKQKCFKFKAIDDAINFKIYLWSSPEAMADRERRVEEGNTKKIEYLENENIFLHEIEGIIHSFWRAIIW